MKNQEIYFTSPGIAELPEYSVPVPQAGEVVVRTVRSTISAGDDLAAILRLVDTGRLSLDEMIEEIHSPVAAPELYAKLTRQKFFPLVQFDWDALGDD